MKQKKTINTQTEYPQKKNNWLCEENSLNQVFYKLRQKKKKKEIKQQLTELRKEIEEKDENTLRNED